MEPRILFEDESLLVLDKPSGVTVNRSDTTTGEETVQDWVENKLKVQIEKLPVDLGSDFYKRGGIVHRLDKETSGVLLIAKTEEAFVNLQTQFKKRSIKKTYIALVHGSLIPTEGEISVPVGRLPWNRKRFGVVAGGRESQTFYKVLETFPNPASKQKEILSLLKLYPQTGRTHQIRVHLKYFNHPIFGDFLYAGRKTSRDDKKFVNRVFLHAAKISFQHPLKGEVITFESPLPSDLLQFLASLASLAV